MSARAGRRRVRRRRDGDGGGGGREAATRALARAQALAATGRMAEAEHGFEEAIASAPAHAPALHAFALHKHATGRAEEAIALLERAVAVDPDDAVALNNLANLLSEQGRGEEAVSVYRRATEVDPDYANAWFNLGTTLRERGDLDAAITALEEAVHRCPDDAGAWNTLGSAHLDTEDLERARECFDRALACDSRHPHARLNRGIALRRAKEFEPARAEFEQLVVMHPRFPEAHNNLGAVLHELGDEEAAERHVREALRLNPDSIPANHNLASVHLSRGEVGPAIERLERCVAGNPEHVAAQCDLSAALLVHGRLDEAERAIEAALRFAPNLPIARARKGRLLIDTGRVDEAVEWIESALGLDPELVEAWVHLADARRFTAEDVSYIGKMEELLTGDRLTSDERCVLSFALGKALQECGRYDEAFERYRRGNELKRAQVEFDLATHVAFVDEVLKVFDREFFAARSGFGVDTEVPVFIVGMPRSGTTLVEQILSSHREVVGGGELGELPAITRSMSRGIGTAVGYPRCARSMTETDSRAFAERYLRHVRELGPHATRITDKLPGNYQNIGLISTLFPKARVIHCRRDAMDVCWSIYSNLFAEGHAYAYRLEELAGVYRQYERLMAHWRAVLRVPMLEVDYEQLVGSQESVSREMVAFCGLEWDDACLAFHENRRPVHTLSHVQVREPMYRSAVARWRRYEEHLEPLARALGNRVGPRDDAGA